MANRKQKAIDPAATLDQAATAAEAGDHSRAHSLLSAYRRWRPEGNPAPPWGDERYGERVDRSGPEITIANPGVGVSNAGLRALADLLLGMVRRQMEKSRGVALDPVAALRDAELALERGDLEAAEKHLEDYDGFRLCGGEEPPGGKEKYALLWKRCRP